MNCRSVVGSRSVVSSGQWSVPDVMWGTSQPGQTRHRLTVPAAVQEAGAGERVAGFPPLAPQLASVGPTSTVLSTWLQVCEHLLLCLCFQDLMNREKKNKIPSMQVGFIDAICLQLYEVFP